MNNKICISCNFHVQCNIIFVQPFKNVDTIFSFWAINKGMVGWIFSMVNSLDIYFLCVLKFYVL